MSQRANPSLVGAFVVGAALLAVVGVILLGGGALFHRKYPFILYFEGDVGGLHVGSPVKYHGVQIGSVTSIRLRLSEGADSTLIPVTIVLDEDLIEAKSGIDVKFDQDTFQKRLKEGLRGRLETESLLTGQVYVGLELAPESPITLIGAPEGFLEIPTLPAASEEFERFIERLKGLDLEEMVANLVEASRALRELATSTEMKAVPASVVRTLESIDGLVQALHGRVEPLGANVADTSAAVQRIAGELEATLRELRPTLESLRATAQTTQEVEADLSRTLATARELMDPDAPLAVQLQTTLQEFGATARSLRALLELVERDPSALLRGKEYPSK